MGGRKEEVMAAIRSRDLEKLSGVGWSEFANYMRKVSASKFGWEDLDALARTYGDHDPELLLGAAVSSVASGETNGFRPTVAQLSKWLGRRTSAGSEASPRRDRDPVALAIVSKLLVNGAAVCSCRPAPTALRRDNRGTLRCQACRGLEEGQVNEAMELGGRGGDGHHWGGLRGGVRPQAETSRYPGGSKAAVAHD